MAISAWSTRAVRIICSPRIDSLPSRCLRRSGPRSSRRRNLVPSGFKSPLPHQPPLRFLAEAVRRSLGEGGPRRSCHQATKRGEPRSEVHSKQNDCSDDCPPGTERALSLRLQTQIQALLFVERRGRGELGARPGCVRGPCSVNGVCCHDPDTATKSANGSALEGEDGSWLCPARAWSSQGRRELVCRAPVPQHHSTPRPADSCPSKHRSEGQETIIRLPGGMAASR